MDTRERNSWIWRNGEKSPKAIFENNYAKRALQAFQKFGIVIEEQNDSSFKNRYGPAQLPYTLPIRSGEEGLTFRGIPMLLYLQR